MLFRSGLTLSVLKNSVSCLLLDEFLHNALCTTAYRGVDTTIVFPARNDSWIVGEASRSYYADRRWGRREWGSATSGLLLHIPKEIVYVQIADTATDLLRRRQRLMALSQTTLPEVAEPSRKCITGGEFNPKG